MRTRVHSIRHEAFFWHGTQTFSISSEINSREEHPVRGKGGGEREPHQEKILFTRLSS
jgi:hypothetical protein